MKTNLRRSKLRLAVNKETLRALARQQLDCVVGGSDNSECYCPGNTDPNSCIAYCGI